MNGSVGIFMLDVEDDMDLLSLIKKWQVKIKWWQKQFLKNYKMHTLTMKQASTVHYNQTTRNQADINPCLKNHLKKKQKWIEGFIKEPQEFGK